MILVQHSRISTSNLIVIHHRLKRLFGYYTWAVIYTDMVIEKPWLIAY
jgi:hypothetical protein